MQLVWVKAEPDEHPRAVAEHHHVRCPGQLSDAGKRLRVGRVRGGGPFARACVDVRVEQFWHRRWVDPQYLSAERGEELSRGRPGDHVGEVEHPEPVEPGPLFTVARSEPDPRLGRDRAVFGACVPCAAAPQRAGDPAGRADRGLAVPAGS
jgi:hypothetical protein